MNKLVFTLLAVTLLGCGNQYGTHYDVLVDSTMSAEEQGSVVDALVEWEREVGYDELTFSVAIGTCDGTVADHLICVHPSTQADLGRLGVTHRYGGGDSADVYLALDAKTPALSEVAAHEIGHAMGLVHTGTGTVMCVNSGCAARTVTCRDAEQYENLRGLPPRGCP